MAGNSLIWRKLKAELLLFLKVLFDLSLEAIVWPFLLDIVTLHLALETRFL